MNESKFTVEGLSLESSFLKCLTCGRSTIKAKNSRLPWPSGNPFLSNLLPVLSPDLLESHPYPNRVCLSVDGVDTINGEIFLLFFQALGQKEQSSLIYSGLCTSMLQNTQRICIHVSRAMTLQFYTFSHQQKIRNKEK